MNINCQLISTDIQSNLIDSKIGRHQATYIPVSNPLLKTTFTRTKPLSVVSRPMVTSNKFQFDRTAVPDDNKNTTVNATNPRHKRELQESTTAIPMDDGTKTTESMPNTSQTIDNNLNETVQQNETYDANDSVPKPIDTSTENLYPSFHVTYWMFYPYSQVNEILFRMKRTFKMFNAINLCCRVNRFAH